MEWSQQAIFIVAIPGSLQPATGGLKRSGRQRTGVAPLGQDRYLADDLRFATTLVTTGRLAEAVGCYDRLIALRPTAKWFNARGCLQASLLRYDEALASFEQAVKLQPDLLDAWSNKGGTPALTPGPVPARRPTGG